MNIDELTSEEKKLIEIVRRCQNYDQRVAQAIFYSAELYLDASRETYIQQARKKFRRIK